jgi:hypothetical protein
MKTHIFFSLSFNILSGGLAELLEFVGVELEMQVT